MPDTSLSVFARIRRTDESGAEYWSARDLAKALGYSGWRRFEGVIERAKTACETSGQATSDHFDRSVNMIGTGKGARREVDDYHLSRYACYLIVQNGDPQKPVIALGQTYFAIQTRRMELSELPEAQRRMALRDEVGTGNVSLAAAVAEAGLVSGKDFAIFQDHGYMGLYAGEKAADIAARKGVTKGEPILDWMGSTELAANWFRITQTEEKLRREGIQGKSAANAVHHAMGTAVRGFILEQGGTPPEQLPTPDVSIRQLRRDEMTRLEREWQPQLFPAEDDES